MWKQSESKKGELDLKQSDHTTSVSIEKGAYYSLQIMNLVLKMESIGLYNYDDIDADTICITKQERIMLKSRLEKAVKVMQGAKEKDKESGRFKPTMYAIDLFKPIQMSNLPSFKMNEKSLIDYGNRLAVGLVMKQIFDLSGHKADYLGI